MLIKNVSSSTSQKKTPSLRWSLRDFKNILPNTFIYESILIKKIKWKLILWIRKYFIFISMASKVIEGHKRSSVFPGILENSS